MKKIIAISLALGCCPAQAFQEDVCPQANGGWGACLENPCEAENEAPHCAQSSSLTALSSTFVRPLRGQGDRSTLHFDATYLLAQAVGFSARDAYIIAAYDEATDSGRYIHLGQDAQLPVDPATCDQPEAPTECWLYSQAITGVVRTNFDAGGIFFHFMPSTAGVDTQAGLTPDVSDALEQPFLYQARRWVYGEGPLCVGGLLASDGQSCFKQTNRPQPLLAGRMPYESETGLLTMVDWTATVGEQTVAVDGATGTALPASQIDTVISPEQAPLARLGIYLHALGDRISHHRCLDVSRIEGPRPADAGPVTLNPLTNLLYQTALHLGQLPEYLQGLDPTPVVADPDYLFVFDTEQCDQSSHFMRHSWEFGRDHYLLQAENQTAYSGLDAILSELEQFASHHGMSGFTPWRGDARAMLLNDILDAIDLADAQDRLDALTALTQSRGYLPLPLYGDLDFDTWSQRAGPAHFEPAKASSRSTSSSGAIDLFGLLLGLLTALTLAARQRRKQARLPTD